MMKTDTLLEKVSAECSYCRQEHVVEKRQRDVQVVVRNETVECKENYYLCAESCEEFMTAELADENASRSRDSYRKKKGLLTAEEIVKIRNYYGLTQNDFAALLGWGEVTVTRYESKTIQDETYDFIMRMVYDNPMFALERIDKHKDRFTLEKYNKIRKNIAEKVENIKKAKAVLHNTDLLQTEFLKNISHEIRTPLNSLLGFANHLLHTNLNEEQKEYLQYILESGKSLLDVVSEILDISEIEAEGIELKLTMVNVEELLEEAINTVKFEAEKKQLSLLLDIAPNVPLFAEFDFVRLKQVLVNILNNAVKFTKIGEVRVQVEFTKLDCDSGSYRFVVRDTGIGIAEECKKDIFRVLSQASASDTKEGRGVGLGLPIAQRLVKKMGGQIEIDSELNNGSTVHFMLRTLYSEKHEGEEPTRLKVKRVLVVDNNQNNQMIMQSYLETMGVSCVGCNDAIAALDAVEKNEMFDVIMVDYRIPYIDGLEFIRMLKKLRQKFLAQPKIILMHSSIERYELYEECESLGVRFRMEKPIMFKELAGVLKNIAALEETDDGENETDTKNAEILPDINILFAEDDELNMKVVKVLLKKAFPHAKLIEAVNGEEAVRIAKDKDIDIILMDIQMPVMSGLDAARQIREHEKGTNRRVPIIAVTAAAFESYMEKCLESGMDDYIAKPIDAYLTVLTLKKHLSQGKIT